MASSKKTTRNAAGHEQYFTKVMDVTRPDGGRRQVTFYAARLEDLKLLNEFRKPKGG
jgi:hypothetical protein